MESPNAVISHVHNWIQYKSQVVHIIIRKKGSCNVIFERTYSNAKYLIRNNSVSPCAGAARATPTRASFALSWRLAEICKKTRTYIYDGELYIVRYTRKQHSLVRNLRKFWSLFLFVNIL